MAVLIEPEVAKAVTAGAAPEMVHLTFPIEKRQDTETVNPLDGTPDLLIWGKATDGSLDSDLQIVDPDWSMKALREWFDTKANVRMQHDPKQPVGKGVEIDGHYVKSLICDPKAKHFIRQGILNDYSVGIINPDVRMRDPAFRHLDPAGKAIHGVITGRPDGLSKIGELTVCDRGANYGSSFAIAKAAADGSMVLVDELTPGEAPDSGLTTVELPSDMKLKVTPAVLAKMATLKRNLVLEEQAMRAAQSEVINKALADPTATVTITRGAQYEGELPEAQGGVEKRKLTTEARNALPDSAFVFPETRSYPIHDKKHARNALARVEQNGTPEEKAKVAAAVARRYPGIKQNAEKAAGAEDKLGQCPTCKGRGFVKKPANMKCEACGGSGRATGKTAEPDVTKCMKCDGSGTFEDKPCPDCKDKAATPDAAKKKGKMRAICPNCGAKQNPEHKHCPECGNALPMRALQVKKNHDFVCLGCGKELDKGEPHCPECGKDNPGYLPEADRKIPANTDAEKNAKERVAEKRGNKKAGKGKPFGGNQAKPFGADGDKEPEGKEPTKKAEKRRKGKSGKRYGRDPAAGVTGHETKGLPPHREPDGAPVEQFENDAHLQDGDQEMKTALRHKSLGIEPHLAVLHDLTCPAFSPDSVSKALPHASLAGIDTEFWQKAALDAASQADITKAVQAWNEAQILSRAAVTLKTADPLMMHRIALAGHEAFLEANKTFRDATPGPGSAPTPGHVMPQSFQRPYISAGHAAASPQYEPARTFPVISDHPQATDFQRGYISAGHATQSPDNSEPRSEPMPVGTGGRQESRGMTAAGMQERDYEQARTTMHDHLSRIAPGMCPMSPPLGATQKPGQPVPDPVGMIEPHGAKASKADRAAAKAKRAAKAAKIKARKAANRAKAQRRFDKAVAAGVAKAASQEVLPDAPAEASAPLDAEVIAVAVKAALAPVVKHQKATDKALRKNRKVLDAIAGQPDTSQAPFRGAGVYKASAVAAPPQQTVAETAERAQAANIQRLTKQWRDSYIPAEREAAWQELTTQLGINPMTGNTENTHPFRT